MLQINTEQQHLSLNIHKKEGEKLKFTASVLNILMLVFYCANTLSTLFQKNKNLWYMYPHFRFTLMNLREEICLRSPN